MSEIRVASRYAKSLLELAIEKGVLEEVNNDMQLFGKTLDENRELLLLMKNPVVGNDKKRTILTMIFGKKFNPMTNTFFDIVSRKNRESFLPAVAGEFHRQYNVYKGVVSAEVITTFPLTPEMRKQFNDMVVKISGKKPELKERIDPTLIGGYILKVGDRQIDESVSSRLTELREEFSTNPYVKEF